MGLDQYLYLTLPEGTIEDLTGIKFWEDFPSSTQRWTAERSTDAMSAILPVETVRLMTAAALALVTVSATVTVDSDEYEDLI